MSKLTISSLLKDLTASPDPDREASERQTRMKAMKDQVLASVEDAGEAPAAPADSDVKKLLLELNSARFATERKKRRLESLQSQLQGMRTEQETVVPLTMSLPEEYERSARTQSLGELSPLWLLERVGNLEEQINDIHARIETEAVVSEQMSALLLKTKDAAFRSKRKMDQLRYLQKRLFRRHEEIVTMQARAANEFIHANHDALKAAEESQAAKAKTEEKIKEKRDVADSLRTEVETMAENTARKLLTQQDSLVKARLTAVEIERISTLHSQQKQVTAAHQETVLRSQAAISSIQRVLAHSESLVQSSAVLDWESILSAYQHMQFQAVSLNGHFASLTKQESELKTKLETLREELRIVQSGGKDAGEVQESLARYIADEGRQRTATVKQLQNFAESAKMDRVELKRIRKSEDFCSSVLLSSSEAVQKLQNFLKYIGKYVIEHPPKLSVVLSQREMPSSLPNITDKPGNALETGSKLSIPGEKRKATGIKKQGTLTSQRNSDRTFLQSFDDSVAETGKGEPVVVTPVIKLRETMAEMFPNRKRAISEVVLAVVESLPMRLSAAALSSKETTQKMRGIDVTNDHIWAERCVSVLLEDSHQQIRQRMYQNYSYASSLLKAAFDSTLELNQIIENRQLTTEQRAEFDRERSKLLSLSAGLPLKEVPDKLWELVKMAFEWKLNSLARQQKGALALEDEFNCFVSKAQNEVARTEEEQARAVSTVNQVKKDMRDFEAEERAQIDLQRKQMRAGVYRAQPTLTRSRSEFIGQNITKMTSIRRSEDLEKLLLEQVQGIERKIKQIKSTERQMSSRNQSRMSVKLPSLHTTPVAERTKRGSSLRFRSTRSPES